MSGVNAKITMKAKTSIDQANTGRRCSACPGARIRRIATISSAAAPSAAISATLSPMSQKSIPMPGEYVRFVNGTYANQPPSGATPNRKLE